MSVILDHGPGVTLTGRALEWRAHAAWARPSWELWDGDHVLLRLRRTGWLDIGMSVEGDGVAWRLGRHGWFDLALTRSGEHEPALRRRGFGWQADETTQQLGLSRWRGDGPIERADGRRWYWRQHGFIRDRYWEVLGDRGVVLATFNRHHRPFRIEGTVRIGDPVESRADSLEAAVFGWFLLLRESAQRAHHAH